MAISTSLYSGSAYCLISPSLELSSMTLPQTIFLSSSPLCYLPGHKLGFAIPRKNGYSNAYTFGLSERGKSIPTMCQTLSYVISFSLQNKLRR